MNEIMPLTLRGKATERYLYMHMLRAYINIQSLQFFCPLN